jgi:nitronate monooxygenase
VFDRLALADLQLRVLGAPMTGGPSTPALAAAVTNVGGLGFLAGGTISAEDLADAILATRILTSGAIGVNLYVPRQCMASREEIYRYAATLEPEAEHYGVALG